MLPAPTTLARPNRLLLSIAAAARVCSSRMQKRFLPLLGDKSRHPKTQTARPLTSPLHAPLPPKESLPYEVRRTAKAGWLPVYREFKNGGTNVSTIIRRIEGDAEALARHLSAFVPPDRIRIHRVTGHIILRGDYLHAVRDFLSRSF
ncbi:mitochondrial large subunit ribosomal protein-domain-containing protein [Zopfochytrium polystomum]|nr:mitochondrial large subunit ribosomal protein-domain-containing protein [Zopfochytrium polystomum]